MLTFVERNKHIKKQLTIGLLLLLIVILISLNSWLTNDDNISLKVIQYLMSGMSVFMIANSLSK
jgi:hypothetical protein